MAYKSLNFTNQEEFHMYYIERVIGHRYLVRDTVEKNMLDLGRSNLFVLFEKSYIMPLAGLLLRGTSTRIIAKMILWLLYPNFHMGNDAGTAWEALDRMVFGNHKMLKM